MLSEEKAKAETRMQGKVSKGAKVEGDKHLRLAMRMSLEIGNHRRSKE